MKIIAALKNLIFPRDIKCLVCDTELSQNTHYSLCDKCLQALPYNNGKTCLKCGAPIHSMAKHCLNCKNHSFKFTRCYAPLKYNGLATKLIKDLKYNNKKYYSQTLGNLIVSSYIENNLNCDIVIPVPLHAKRQQARGFNQAELLCTMLQEKLTLFVDTKSVVRLKNTLTQTHLKKSEREQNVKDAFKVLDKNAVKGKTVLIVDDVYTTGSTLNELSKVLLKSGAQKVYCITLAHAEIENAL